MNSPFSDWRSRPSEIVDAIISYARAHPGSIRVVVRDAHVKTLVAVLRQCGIRKRMFEGAVEFVKKSFLESWSALAAITPDILLSVRTSDGQRVYWRGTGHKSPYGGVDLSELPGPDCSEFLELEIDAMFDELKPLLEQ